MIKDGGKIKISTYFYILFVLFIMCVGGYLVFFWPGKAVTELGKLAYDVNPRLGYEIYLKEGEAYVPYLVLTDDYDGNVLLLRKELLPESRSFLEKETHGWSNGDFAAYYESSSIDQYLNTEFINFLGDLNNEIEDSRIVIAEKGKYKFDPEKTITIERKVFLLSLVELDITNYYPYTCAYEGEPLKYFADGNYERRYAKRTGGGFNPYWTRSPEMPETTYEVFGIGTHGLGSGGAEVYSGVRPAFCLNGSQAVIQSSDIVAGKEVYILK